MYRYAQPRSRLATDVHTSRIFRHSLLRLGVLLFAGALPVGTHAQSPEPVGVDPGASASQADPATPAAAQVEEIVVTARRRDERLIDVPVAITAVSGETLDAYGVTDFTDIATLVPSLIMGRAASGSAASIFLRGVGSTALSAGFDQSVSFVVDGLPMSRGREISLSQYDVQRVEVLKGPQALFYGKNTTGGLISVVTNGPGGQFEAGGKAGYGVEAREFYSEAYVSGPIADKFAARLAARFSDSDGAFENSAADEYPIPFDLVRRSNSEYRGFGETQSARLTLQYDPVDSLRLELKTGVTSQEDGGPTDIVERICGDGRNEPSSANGIPPSPNADCRVDGVSDSSDIPPEVAQTLRYARDGNLYADLSSQFAILTGSLSLDRIEVSSITSFYQFEQSDLNNVSGEGYPASFTQYADYRQFAEELRLQTQFDGAFNVMAGVFVSSNQFTFNTDAWIFNVPPDTTTGTYATFKRDNGFEGDTVSAFLEGTYAFFENWELSAGARWSREERDSYQRSLPGHAAFAQAFPPGVVLEDSFSDSNVSPQATVRWKPARDVSLYAGYREGFKSGGYNISQSLIPGASVEAGEFGSEKASGFEAGARAILINGTLNVGVTLYDYLYEDLQVQNFDPVSVGQVADNAGELRTRGIESEVNWLVGGGASLRAALAYNQAKYHDYVGQCYGGQTVAEGCDRVPGPDGAYTSQNYEGRTPPKAPQWSGRVGGAYERVVFGDLTLQVSADVSHTSRYNYTDSLRPDGYQDAYSKLDAAMRLIGMDEKWEVALIGRNLTDELVVTAANDIPFTGGSGTGTDEGVLSDMSAFVENPREVMLEFSFRY